MATRSALGVDVGGTTTKLAVVTADGKVVADDVFPTNGRGDRSEFTAGLKRQVGRIRDEAERKEFPIAGIGVVVAGLLDSKRSRLVYNPNLPSLVGFPLAETLEDWFRCPVVLDADSNAACVGELRFGAGRGSRRLLSLTVGTGLGVGVAVDGQILRVAQECLGDAGHVIVQPGGRPCSAGCHGCAEAMVSAGALESWFESASGIAAPAREILALAHSGNECARMAIEETGRWLGIGIASLATIFLPDCIVISGGISEAGELLLAPAIESFRACAAPMCSDGVAVLQARFGWRATVIGAAAMLL